MAAPTIIRPQLAYIEQRDANYMLDLTGNVEVRLQREIIDRGTPWWFPTSEIAGKEWVEIRIPFTLTDRKDTSEKKIPWIELLKTLPLDCSESWTGTAAPYTFNGVTFSITQQPSHNVCDVIITEGNQYRKFTNCKISSLTISKDAQNQLILEATLYGLYSSTGSATNVGIGTSTNYPTLCMQHNSGSFGENYICRSARMTITPTLAERPKPEASPFITDWRATSVTITIESEMEADAAAWSSKIRDSLGTQVNFLFRWGNLTIGGTTFTIDTNLKGTLQSYDIGDADGIRTWSYTIQVDWDDTYNEVLKLTGVA